LACQYRNIANIYGEKAIVKTIGIFKGKQKKYDEKLLTLLFDNGPLTAWELTGKIRKTGKQSLHPTLNKRLRELEKRSYIQRVQRKWCLMFKGIIAVLLIQKKPRPWNPKWTELFTKAVDGAEDKVLPSMERYGLKKKDIHVAVQKLNLCLDDFDAWIGLSKKVKELMENGLVNLDVIKQETLLGVIMLETMTPQQLQNIWKPDTEQNEPK
jgi:hypothetical protein